MWAFLFVSTDINEFKQIAFLIREKLTDRKIDKQSGMPIIGLVLLLEV